MAKAKWQAPDNNWPDGINPAVEQAQVEAIIKARKDRAQQLEAWQKGAGYAYCRALDIGDADMSKYLPWPQ